MALIINLFGGPGAGKSTNALCLMRLLSHTKFSAVLVPELATQLLEQGKPLLDQRTMYNVMLTRLVKAQVHADVVIMESPLLLNLVYYKERASLDFLRFIHEVLKDHHQFNNCNYFLRRPDQWPYAQGIRPHTEEEARIKDLEILQVLNTTDNFSVLDLRGDMTTAIFNDIFQQLVAQREYDKRFKQIKTVFDQVMTCNS